MVSFIGPASLCLLYVRTFVRASEGFLSMCESPALKPKINITARFVPGKGHLGGRFEANWRINQVEITDINAGWFPKYLRHPPPGASTLVEWKCLPSIPNSLADVKEYIAVVLRGFSFSYGPSLPFMVGFNVKAQRYATESQLNLLIKPLEDLGYGVHIFSATYSTEFTDELMTLFGKRLKSDTRSDWQQIVEPWAETLNAFESVAGVSIHANRHAVTYRTITILRHDVHFKQNVAPLVLGCREFCVPVKSSGEDLNVRNSSGLLWLTMHGGYLGCLLDILNLDNNTCEAGNLSCWYETTRPGLFAHTWSNFAVRLQEFMQRIDRKVKYLVDDSVVSTSRKHNGLDAERSLFTTIGQCKEPFRNTLNGMITNAPPLRALPWKCKPNTDSLSEHSFSEESKKFIAVVLRGASFRSARVHQGNYMIGFDPDLQMIGTQSILDHLIKPLEALGYTVDVFSSTYTTAFTYMILEKLSKHLKSDIRTPWIQMRRKMGQYKGIMQVILSVYSYAQQQKITYRIVTMLRHDMQLKQNVASLVLACDTQFCVPFRAVYRGWPYSKTGTVPDTWQTMPWELFKCMLDTLMKLHYWPFGKLGQFMAHQIGEDKVGFLDSNVTADSDPAKFPNPFYRLCSRPEGHFYTDR